MSDLETFIEPAKLREDVAVDDLDRAFREQAALRLWYATQAAKAKEQHSKAKLSLEIVEASVAKELREKAATAGEKIVEARINSELALDRRVFAARKRVIEAESIFGACAAAADSFRDRKDMLVQIGADRRSEREGEMRIRVRDPLDEPSAPAAEPAGKGSDDMRARIASARAKLDAA